MVVRKVSTSFRDWISTAIIVSGFTGNIAVQVWSSATDSHVTAAQVIVLTAQAKDLAATLHALADKLDDLPRPAEFVAQANHVTSLDQRTGSLEVAVEGVKARVTGLEATERMRR
jgi:hypothetical protein